MTSETGEPRLDSLLSVATGFMAARALLTAVELDVFTLLGDGPRTGARIAGEVGLHARGTPDFLDALVALDLLERDGDAYRNGPAADLYLDRRKPTYVGGVLERMATGDYPRWGSLTEALRTGAPRDTGPQETPDGTTWVLAPVARALVDRLDWSRFTRVVEVGGPGLLTIPLAQAHPHVSGGVVDAAPSFAGDVERLFLDDRLAALDAIIPADAYVLGARLSRLGAGERAALLAEVYAALPEGGAVVVHDTMADDDRRRNSTALLASLGLLLQTPAGRQDTAAECRAGLTAAGFRDITTEDLGHGWTAVIGLR